MNNFQKTGGVAALIHAAAYIVGFILCVILIFPVMGADPGQFLAFVVSNQSILYIWNLITYWVSAVALVIMALALYERLKAGAPALMQTATVFGLIWAALNIASCNLMLHNLGVIANLYTKDLALAATIWPALEAVETGIVSGNELVGSLWVLLLSVAALRTGGLTKALNYFGLALSAVGILTLIPAFVAAMGLAIFGLGMVAWSIWVGIVILRNRSSATG